MAVSRIQSSPWFCRRFFCARSDAIQEICIARAVVCIGDPGAGCKRRSKHVQVTNQAGRFEGKRASARRCRVFYVGGRLGGDFLVGWLGGQDRKMTRPQTRNLANEAACNARLAPSSAHHLRGAARKAVAKSNTKSRELGRNTAAAPTLIMCGSVSGPTLPLIKTRSQLCQGELAQFRLAPLLPDRDVTPVGILARHSLDSGGRQPTIRSLASYQPRQHRRRLAFADRHAYQSPKRSAIASLLVR